MMPICNRLPRLTSILWEWRCSRYALICRQSWSSYAACIQDIKIYICVLLLSACIAQSVHGFGERNLLVKLIVKHIVFFEKRVRKTHQVQQLLDKICLDKYGSTLVLILFTKMCLGTVRELVLILFTKMCLATVWEVAKRLNQVPYANLNHVEWPRHWSYWRTEGLDLVGRLLEVRCSHGSAIHSYVLLSVVLGGWQVDIFDRLRLHFGRCTSFSHDPARCKCHIGA